MRKNISNDWRDKKKKVVMDVYIHIGLQVYSKKCRRPRDKVKESFGGQSWINGQSRDLLLDQKDSEQERDTE